MSSGQRGFVTKRLALSIVFLLASMQGLSRAEAQCDGGTPDGIVTVDEACDDGNNTTEDGCDNTCAIETDFSCQRVLRFGGPNFVVEEYGGGTTANWIPDADSLGGVQTVNAGQPSIVMFGEDAMQGTYVFDLGVDPSSSDDDFFGMVVGFNPGDTTNAAAKFMLVDWKQATQSSGGNVGRAGMALSVVDGTLVSTGNHGGNDFWSHTGSVTELQRSSSLGDTGWEDPRLYRFQVTYRPDRLIVSIDGVIQFDVRPSDFPANFPTGEFPMGQIGFQTLSQENVRADNIGSFGPSICNTTSVADATIWTTDDAGSATVDVAGYFSDPNGDGLNSDAVLVTSSPTGVTTTDPAGGAASGMIDVTLTGGPGSYPVEYTACDNNTDVAHCDTATVTVIFNDDPTVTAPTSNVLGATATLTPADIEAASSTNVVDGGWDTSSLAVASAVGGPYGTSTVASAQGGTCEIVGGEVVYTPPAVPTGPTDSCFIQYCELNPGPAGTDGTGRSCGAHEQLFSIDADGDGIPNADEGDGDPDMDMIPNYLDIDSDGDGITDDVEGLAAPDSDMTPAFLDDDSDGDGIPDSTEGHDADMNGVADRIPVGNDADGDGLDDAFDTDCPATAGCAGVTGVTAPVQNSGGDPAPDYLDADDDGDGIPTLVEGTTDSDGVDGPNYLDTDSDGDGVDDATECPSTPCQNNDTDMLPDFLDVDDDGDGIPTLTEGTINTDADPQPDYLDTDSDGDDIPDATEAHDGDADGTPDTVPAGVDTDADGLDDAYDPDCAAAGDCGGVIGVTPAFPNTDMDAAPDHLDIDADGDGIPDAVECGAMICAASDMDGTPDYLDTDSDDDGVIDAIEGHDADGDGIADVEAVSMDSDGDGLDDAFDPSCAEAGDCLGIIGVPAPTPNRDMDDLPDYQDPDDDGDGIDTATEIADEATHGDPDMDGMPAYLDLDSDDDMSPDLTEAGLDLDEDGVPDYLDPNSSPTDTDEDGIPDVFECADLSMPDSCVDTDMDGTPNWMDPDDDGDGVPTRDERPAGNQDTDEDGMFDHLDDDDDGDGVPTATECPDSSACIDTDMDGMPDYTDDDDDNDGILTSIEVADGMMHGDDVDADGIVNWLDTDSDDDGVLDSMECPDASACPDEDEDGVPDYLDASTMPSDRDGDGVPDDIECPDAIAGCPDTDDDGTPDIDDTDDDGDGILTLHELPLGDTDGDGRDNYLDPDDDNDGVDTRFEGADANGDGDPSDAQNTDSDTRPDYLDVDDDGDGMLTRSEGADPNNDGNPEDARDLDGDEIPSYLDADEATPAGAGLSGGAPCSASGRPGSSSGSSAPWLMILALGIWVRRRRSE